MISLRRDFVVSTFLAPSTALPLKLGDLLLLVGAGHSGHFLLLLRRLLVPVLMRGFLFLRRLCAMLLCSRLPAYLLRRASERSPHHCWCGLRLSAPQSDVMVYPKVYQG